MTRQHMRSRPTTTWDNPFLEPARSPWRVALAVATLAALLLGLGSALFLAR